MSDPDGRSSEVDAKNAAQLALSVNIDAATATAISDAAITGVAENTEANIATPASACSIELDRSSAVRPAALGIFSNMVDEP